MCNRRLLLNGSDGENIIMKLDSKKEARSICWALTPAAFDDKTTPSLAATSDGRLVALMPMLDAAVGGDGRYRVPELLDMSATQAAVARPVLATAETLSEPKWFVVVALSKCSFARYSNILVGVDGASPVVWDMSSGRLKRLEVRN
jgi:hypothetical protein